MTPPLLKDTLSGSVELLPSQLRYWVQSHLINDQRVLNVPGAYFIKGKLNRQILEESFCELVNGHELLRTSFVAGQENPQCIIHGHATPSIEWIEMCDTDLAPRELAQREIVKFAGLKMDLTEPPLFKIRMVTISPEQSILLLLFHSIISDSQSINILIKEVFRLYDQFCQGNITAANKIQLDEVSLLSTPDTYTAKVAPNERIDFWKEKLKNDFGDLKLPYDNSRPMHGNFNGKNLSFELDPDLTDRLRTFLTDNQFSLKTVLLATFKVLLHKYADANEIIVGAVMNHRKSFEEQNMVECFEQLTPIKTDFHEHQTLMHILHQVKENVLLAYGDKDISFEKTIMALQPKRLSNFISLFQTTFELKRTPEPITSAHLSIRSIDVDTATSMYDISLSFTDISPAIKGEFRYNSDMFNQDTIERMNAHYHTLLEKIIVNPEVLVANTSLLNAEESRIILYDWNKTHTDYPNACIHQIFEGYAEQMPNQHALVFQGEIMTYRELNEKSNQLAHFLQKAGVKPQENVGICIHKSPDFVIAVLAVLKAAGVYVPIDANYPKERLSYIADDLKCKVIITDCLSAESFDDTNISFIYPGKEWVEIDKENTANLELLLDNNSGAYVMYTSGSTGIPKGVHCIHKGITRLVKQTNFACFDSDRSFLLQTNVCFDTSTFELWGALLNGGRLVIHDEKIPSLEGLAKTIRQYHVTTSWFTSGLFHLMVDNKIEGFHGLKELVVGGDVISITHARKFLLHHKECRLVNGYGPTENTTFTTAYEINQITDTDLSVPIGKPISNTRVYILDSSLNPVPVGIKGELYAAGDGLATEYINSPELTREKFFTRQFTNDLSEVLYKTGDVAKYRADGTIEFFGRKDNQFKIRGYRIETGEIVSALLQHEKIKDCVIVIKEDATNQKYLVAYIKSTQAKEKIQSRELYNFLKEKLPAFMIPSSFVVMDELPLNQNGKIDTRRLREIDSKVQDEEESSHAYIETPTQKILINIWKDILNLKQVNIFDNFFQIGGHSLLAIKMFNDIDKQFGIRLPVSIIFQKPSVKDLADVITNQTPQRWEHLHPVQKEGSQPIFFAIPGGFFYKDLIESLGNDQPFYCFEPLNDCGVKESAARYVKELLECQPSGPYYLGAYCQHGPVAMEMAQQLIAQGKSVASLVLFEFYAPEAILHKTSSRYLIKKVKFYYRQFTTGSFKERFSFFKGEFSRAGVKFRQKLKNTYSDKYLLEPYAGNVTLFKASVQDVPFKDNPETAWAKYFTSGMNVIQIEGDHHSIFKLPAVNKFSTELKEVLHKAKTS